MAGSNSINIVATFNGTKAFEGINRLERSFSRLKKIVMTVIAGKVVKEMANFGNQMSLMSERTGMSISKLSALRNAFIASGAGAKSFEKTISNINEGLLGLSMGRGDFAAKLGMLGISPYTKGGALKSADQVMYDIADWAASQKGRMSRQDILYRLTSLFGFDDATAVKMLTGGAAMRGSAAAASARMGLVSPEQIQNLDNLKKKIDEFFGTIKNTFAKVTGELAPKIMPILEKLQQLIKVAGDNPKATAAIVGIVAGFATLATTLGMVSAALPAVLLGIKGLAIAFSALAAFGIGHAVGYGFATLVTALFGGDAKKQNEIYDKYRIDGYRMDMDAVKKSYDALASKGYKTKDEQLEYMVLQNFLRQVEPNYPGLPETLPLPDATTATTGAGTTIQQDIKTEIYVQGNADHETVTEMGEKVNKTMGTVDLSGIAQLGQNG